MAHSTNEAYVACAGQLCPCCNSNEISGGPFTAESAIAWQEITCSDCGASWNDQYTLTGYVLVEEPTNTNVDE
jgi:transposase-like protein